MSDTVFDLVIFDCDGVLIDSEIISAQMLVDELRGFGVRIDLPYQLCRHRASVLGPHTKMTMAAVNAMTGPPTPMSKCEPLTGNSM